MLVIKIDENILHLTYATNGRVFGRDEAKMFYNSFPETDQWFLL